MQIAISNTRPDPASVRRNDASGMPSTYVRHSRSRWRYIVPVIAAGLYLLTIPLTLLAASDSPHPVRFAPGRLLVEPKAGVSDADFQATLATRGGKSVGKLRGMKTHVVSLPAGAAETEVAAWLTRHSNVKYAELDRLLATEGTPNDPSLPSEWHLAKIGAPTAWDTATGAGTIIAILDTGVDPAHPDLIAQLVPGWNFYDNNSNTADVYGHGTAVAGTAAAAANNAVGVASVAYGARIMPVRVSDPSGSAYISTIAQALTWAADHGARVANISFGAGGSPTVQSAAQYFRSKGGVVAVSAGNSGVADTAAPTDTLIVVSATDANDTKTSWSTYGSFVKLAAPGLSILTTSNGGNYQYWSGTSFSAPIVAGVAALVKSLHPEYTAAQVESVLFSTAVDVGAAGKDILYGYGRVSAQAAVAAASSGPPPETTPPSATIAAPTGGTVSGSVNVTVSASDNVGVMRVDLKVNGLVIASDTTAPFTFVWNSASLPDGAATMSATAYDAAGNFGTSAPVAISVANSVSNPPPAPPDTTAPTVAITNPANRSKLSKNNVTVNVSASDAGGIASLVLSVDGAIVASGNTGTLTYLLNPDPLKSGNHTLTATARDNAGNASAATVTVKK